MYYYEVAPAGKTYIGRKLLTYSSVQELDKGQVIVVKVRTSPLYAFIVKQVKKPSFKVAPVEEIIDNLAITNHQLELFLWINDYYPSGIGPSSRLFLPPSFKIKRNHTKKGDVLNTSKKVTPPTLTTQQDRIASSILHSEKQTHILHGDTGTGKTRIYIELAKQIIEQKRSVIILTPEISLTPQLFEQFNSVFSNVHMVHSALTAAERRDIWLNLRSNDTPQLILGPRSALFYPLPNVGLIVIDEFHDSAYKQDQSPRYNALRVAGMISKISDAKLVLGSATPPIEDYFYAVHRGADVHRLTEKPLPGIGKTRLHVIDLRKENEYSKHPLLSNTLIDLIQKKLENNEQSLLFLNKRGSSRLIVCQSCGWNAVCSRCNIPYTYHEDQHRLICHICNKSENAPNICPQCSSTEILFKNPGTKAIASSLEKIFPNAKIGRYDKDNTKKESFSENQNDISAGKVDILIGTQLLAKGHDLPKLGLVGILLAESSLQFPDYNSEEKSFQLLHQIAGRVGRGHVKGDVVLQTYQPDSRYSSYINQAENDWINFYSHELEQRQKYNFPPYAFLLKVEVSRKTEKSAEEFIQKIYEMINRHYPNGLEILGPAPAFFYKRNGLFFWQMIIKSRSRNLLISVIDSLPNSCTYDIDPLSLL